jgi:signal transduction histidine kinase
MANYLHTLFDVSELSPHGLCLLWRPELVWLHIISDSVIALAYYSIPIVLAVFVTRRADIAFGWVFWAFAIFILACGTTHIFGIWTLFVPDYGIEGIVKAVTALASLVTAIGLLPLLPKALAIPSPSQLRQANEALQAEVRTREATVAELEREKEERAKAEEMLRHSQRMEAIGQLTAGIAHDFNNLLTVIMGSLEKANRKAEQSDELARIIGRGYEAAERAAVLTSRLLAFGRQKPLATETINPHVPLEAAVDTLRSTIGSEGHRELRCLFWTGLRRCSGASKRRLQPVYQRARRHAGRRQHRRLHQVPPRPGPVASRTAAGRLRRDFRVRHRRRHGPGRG